MRITYSNDNIRFTVEDDNYEDIKEMVKFLLDHPQSRPQLEQTEPSPSETGPVESVEEVKPCETRQVIEPDIVPYENIPEPEANNIQPILPPKTQEEYYKLLETINISSPKECRGKYFNLIEYFKFWDNEKDVAKFINDLENNRELQLAVKNPANHLRWLCHIIHSITAYYKFFDAKFILEKREHYHRLRSGYNLKKADSKSVE